MARAKPAPVSAQSSANIGFEAKLWLAADWLLEANAKAAHGYKTMYPCITPDHHERW